MPQGARRSLASRRMLQKAAPGPARTRASPRQARGRLFEAASRRLSEGVGMKCAELQNRDIGTGHQIKAIYERPTFACVKQKWSLMWSAMANSIADAGGPL